MLSTSNTSSNYTSTASLPLHKSLEHLPLALPLDCYIGRKGKPTSQGRRGSNRQAESSPTINCVVLCCAVLCADAVLDACLAQDPNSKVACETAVKDNFMMVRVGHWQAHDYMHLLPTKLNAHILMLLMLIGGEGHVAQCAAQTDSWTLNARHHSWVWGTGRHTT